MSIVKRMKQPTPRFFKTVRNIGLTMATIGGAVVAAPLALPAAVVTVAGYITVAGTVASAVSQAVTEPNERKEADEDGTTGEDKNIL